ncbi:MAG: PAS sensor domain-containing protein [Arcobacter sp.]|nr:PAS sensor domain-containing protein [Arcobacter sp.]|tara:strand:+ start:3754 stop:4140 length:387 start_codon:yes stop_codon:yes gene_type:complete
MKEEELKLSEESFLLSETDEKGIIRYANDEFCEYAEYTLEELVGKPHNMVRHPDMPKAAFEDLWKTVKSGTPWKGFVKNKTKHGKYYWVFATVFPFTSCDGSKGYISCRRMASTKEINKYENLYKTMK